MKSTILVLTDERRKLVISPTTIEDEEKTKKELDRNVKRTCRKGSNAYDITIFEEVEQYRNRPRTHKIYHKVKYTHMKLLKSGGDTP